MKRKVFIALIILGFSGPGILNAQDEGFIYGTITTIDGNKYQGPIRWGKEEVYWFDMFNATKKGSKYNRPSDEDSKDWGLSIIWKDVFSNSTHSFVCRFGDIQSLEMTGRERVRMTIKDGTEFELGGGSNDMGASVRIIDVEIGEMKIRWDRIERVDFENTPRKLEESFGTHLYGEVQTRQNGKFTGYIQWDHDERVGLDVLDGDSREGDMSIQFKNLKSIEKEGNRCRVVLKSGREFLLGGSNDVNNGNRGIIVSTVTMGRVDIPWSEFVRVDFSDYKSSGPSYKSYGTPKKLRGRVITTSEDEYEGLILYDMDEGYDLEILQGKDDEVEYQIPFRSIKRITRKNYNYSQIEFHNGKTVLLGDIRDVSDANAGLLVFTRAGREPKRIRWSTVLDIYFD